MYIYIYIYIYIYNIKQIEISKIENKTESIYIIIAFDHVKTILFLLIQSRRLISLIF